MKLKMSLYNYFSKKYALSLILKQYDPLKKCISGILH